jgi:hypothetical protein
MQVFLQLIVALVVISATLANRGNSAAAPSKEKNVIQKSVDFISTVTKGHSLRAEVKDTETGGLEGLNLKLSAPFKFMDYVVGVKASIGDFHKLSPDTLFVKRSFDAADGKLKVEADYDMKSKDVDVKTEWSNDRVTLNADGNTQNFLTTIAAKTHHNFEGASRNLKATVSGAYDLLSKKVSTVTRLDVDNAAAELQYDTEKEDPVLKVTYNYNKHTLSPKISLKSGDVTYGYKRTNANGALDTSLVPGEKVTLEWTDNSSSGAWKTKVDVPLQDQSKTKVSFARDWAL